MGEPRKKPATYEDLLKLPAHVVGEIIGGDLIVSPRPATPHAYTAGLLGDELAPFKRDKGGPGGPGGWWILPEPELHLHADVLVPDLGGWRRERMPDFPYVAALELPPDWACEILSPSTASVDRTRKLAVYAREQVGHVWLLDPLLRSLEAMRLVEGRWTIVTILGPDSEPRARIEPFEELEIDVARLWPPPRKQ